MSGLKFICPQGEMLEIKRVIDIQRERERERVCGGQDK